MMVPIILGFPLWRGHIKRRVAKKYLNKWNMSWTLLQNESLSHLGVGDLIQDCSCYNVKITALSPEYVSIGSGRGQLLVDVQISTEYGGYCSWYNCGVRAALPRQEIERQLRFYMEKYTLSDAGKTFWGEEREEQTRQARKNIAILDSGGHITDDLGRRLAPPWLPL